MEVLVGPTYDMEVSAAAATSSSPSCVRERTNGVPPAPTPAPAQAQDKAVSSSCLFLNADEEYEEEGVDHKTGDQFGSGHGSADSPESSSSIGVPGDSEDENENGNDEVSSHEREELYRTKFSMDLLGDNLPIKRGLSNHYHGKSKSFGNLSEVSSVKDLEKEVNPFNKRRRVLIASKLWSRNSFYSQSNPKSMPLLPILPDEDDDGKQQEEDEVLDDDEDQHQVKH